jgi:cytochrome c peroxidase
MSRTGHALAALAVVVAAIAAATAAAAAEDLAALKAKYQRPADIPFPAANPYTPEKAALGKALFFDPRLSGHQNMNCASCHNPSFGWEVPLRGAIGSQNTMLARNAPTVLNQAWVGPDHFWDGRASSLEEQAKGPIEAKDEMNLPLGEAARRLEVVPDYRKRFGDVFPAEGITGDTIVKAIATFERTVVSGYAPFDAWIDGDNRAISESAQRGFMLFNGKARCATCHTGWNFTDNKFHDVGIATTDVGRALVEPDNPKARHAFKTPGLRDITHRAPYMHDGSLPDLDTVIVRYISIGTDRPSLSPDLKAIELGPQDMADLVAFLKTLTGRDQVVSLPILPY